MLRKLWCAFTIENILFHLFFLFVFSFVTVTACNNDETSSQQSNSSQSQVANDGLVQTQNNTSESQSLELAAGGTGTNISSSTDTSGSFVTVNTGVNIPFSLGAMTDVQTNVASNNSLVLTKQIPSVFGSTTPAIFLSPNQEGAPTTGYVAYPSTGVIGSASSNNFTFIYRELLAAVKPTGLSYAANPKASDVFYLALPNASSFNVNATNASGSICSVSIQTFNMPVAASSSTSPYSVSSTQTLSSITSSDIFLSTTLSKGSITSTWFTHALSTSGNALTVTVTSGASFSSNTVSVNVLRISPSSSCGGQFNLPLNINGKALQIKTVPLSLTTAYKSPSPSLSANSYSYFLASLAPNSISSPSQNYVWIRYQIDNGGNLNFKVEGFNAANSTSTYKANLALFTLVQSNTVASGSGTSTGTSASTGTSTNTSTGVNAAFLGSGFIPSSDKVYKFSKTYNSVVTSSISSNNSFLYGFTVPDNQHASDCLEPTQVAIDFYGNTSGTYWAGVTTLDSPQQPCGETGLDKGWAFVKFLPAQSGDTNRFVIQFQNVPANGFKTGPGIQSCSGNCANLCLSSQTFNGYSPSKPYLTLKSCPSGDPGTWTDQTLLWKAFYPNPSVTGFTGSSSYGGFTNVDMSDYFLVPASNLNSCISASYYGELTVQNPCVSNSQWELFRLSR